MKIEQWPIELRKVSDLKEHPNNPRKFTKKGLQDLEASLKSIGYIDKIVVNHENTILGGHARKKTLKKLGVKEVYCCIPPRALTEAEENEIMIRLNRNTAGEWDFEILEDKFDKADLIEYGFEKSDFNSFPASSPTPPKALEYPIFTQQAIINHAFEVFRERGFPYPKLDTFEMMLELNKLASLPEEALERTIAGYAIADTYHPHRFHAAACKMKSPIEGYDDDVSLKKVLKMTLDQNQNLSYKKLPFMSLVNGVQACSNFRPGYAKLMYDRYASGGRVFDSSTGYGGRLVGFLASNAKEYIGVDPNVPTHRANMQLAGEIGAHKRVTLHNSPIEVLDVERYVDSCDLAFTSPPYFIKEEYSDDDTQSCVRYPEYDQWIAGFLIPMLKKQFAVLKPGATNIVNIEDVKIKTKSFALVKDTIDCAVRLGFIYVETKQFELQDRTSVKDGETISKAASESVIIMRKPS